MDITKSELRDIIREAIEEYSEYENFDSLLESIDCLNEVNVSESIKEAGKKIKEFAKKILTKIIVFISKLLFKIRQLVGKIKSKFVKPAELNNDNIEIYPDDLKITVGYFSFPYTKESKYHKCSWVTANNIFGSMDKYFIRDGIFYLQKRTNYASNIESNINDLLHGGENIKYYGKIQPYPKDTISFDNVQNALSDEKYGGFLKYRHVVEVIKENTRVSSQILNELKFNQNSVNIYSDKYSNYLKEIEKYNTETQKLAKEAAAKLENVDKIVEDNKDTIKEFDGNKYYYKEMVTMFLRDYATTCNNIIAASNDLITSITQSLTAISEVTAINNRAINILNTFYNKEK